MCKPGSLTLPVLLKNISVELIVSSFSLSAVVCVQNKLPKIYNYSISIVSSLSSFDLEKINN